MKVLDRNQYGPVQPVVAEPGRAYRGSAIARNTTRTAVRAKSLTADLALWLSAGIVMVGIGFVVSSLMGSVALESARHASISSSRRANFAEQASRELAREVSGLSSEQNVASWSAVNGFVPVYAQVAPTQVASPGSVASQVSPQQTSTPPK